MTVQPKNPNLLTFQFKAFEQLLCEVLGADADMLGIGGEHEGIVELRKLAEHILRTLYNYKDDRLIELRKNDPRQNHELLSRYLGHFEFFARMQWSSVFTVVEYGYREILESAYCSPFCTGIHDLAQKELTELYSYSSEQFSELKKDP